MRDRLLAAAMHHGGVLTRRQALAVAPHHVLDKAVAAGALTRVFPSTYVLTTAAADPVTRRRAALRYVPAGALSHLDALEGWAVISPRDSPGDIHVSVPRAGARTFAVPGLRVHRRTAMPPTFTLNASGL